MDGEIKFIPAINEYQSQCGVLNYRELVWKVFVLQGNPLFFVFQYPANGCFEIDIKPDVSISGDAINVPQQMEECSTVGKK